MISPNRPCGHKNLLLAFRHVALLQAIFTLPIYPQIATTMEISNPSSDLQQKCVSIAHGAVLCSLEHAKASGRREILLSLDMLQVESTLPTFCRDRQDYGDLGPH